MKPCKVKIKTNLIFSLRLIKAFQFVEQHGEVCPAGWTPDSPTIKPDPKGSLEYFDKVN